MVAVCGGGGCGPKLVMRIIYSHELRIYGTKVGMGVTTKLNVGEQCKEQIIAV